jgi:cell division protein FtsW
MWRTASVLLAAVLILATLGIIMQASTSGVKAEAVFGDAHYFVKRQALWLVVSLAVFFFCARVIPLRAWRTFAAPLAGVTALLLLLVFVPGVGVTVKGSSRWIAVGPMSFQPSELAKLSVVVLLSWWGARAQRWSESFLRGFLIPMVALASFAALILIEPDYGTTMLVGVVGLTILFLGGTRLSYLFTAAVVGGVGLITMIMRNEVRMRRIVAFLDPEKYQQDAGFQLLQSKYALVTGGATGTGLGDSLQKRYYLPEAHTDFIFAIIGEELGAVATLSVLALYLVIFVCGLRMALKTHDPFAQRLAFGITLMITFQALINIGVVTGSLPTKGLPLPFLSFGGSSLVMSFAMVGLLLNIARHVERDERKNDSSAIKDRARWV